jgi:preprotein translocase subunit SecY
LFLALYVGLIVFFAFFYTAIVFNPTETADNLKKHGGFIPGIRPGERTAEYIDYVLSRITVIGAAYLAIVCLFPEMLISYAAVPFYFGGTSLLLLPTTVANFTAGQGPGWLTTITTQLSHGRPLFLALYVGLIVFFAFFYTAIVFNPTETADNLKKHGGFIPGIRPGERTAEYIDYVLSRITVIGAAYLAIVCLFPEMLISYAAVPFYFGGTSLLIVVSVTMDTVAQVQGYLLAHQYEGLIKRSKLRGRRR